jgi:hypothetical protein
MYKNVHLTYYILDIIININVKCLWSKKKQKTKTKKKNNSSYSLFHTSVSKNDFTLHTQKVIKRGMKNGWTHCPLEYFWASKEEI